MSRSSSREAESDNKPAATSRHILAPVPWLAEVSARAARKQRRMTAAEKEQRRRWQSASRTVSPTRAKRPACRPKRPACRRSSRSRWSKQPLAAAARFDWDLTSATGLPAARSPTKSCCHRHSRRRCPTAGGAGVARSLHTHAAHLPPLEQEPLKPEEAAGVVAASLGVKEEQEKTLNGGIR